MKLLIKNGRVIDPANSIDGINDVLVEGTSIVKVATKCDAAADETIDATGCIVMPGIVDMHVHLREPGREDKETVATGTAAAAKGGVTTLLAMPNTYPAIDAPEHVKLLQAIVQRTAAVNVLVCGSITKGRKGEELTDFAELKRCGVVAVSDDGNSVDNEELMREALRQARKCGLAVICHCEDKSLTAGGVINLGLVSTRLGLRGVANESEYKRVERDIALAEGQRAALHVAHVSCKESVAAIAQAKKRGVQVTAETAPHYFSLTEEALLEYDTNMKMNPPLKAALDVTAIKEGLRSGVLDCIASDHAPHTINEKDIEFDRAEFGVVGLETELSVAITELINKGFLDWGELVRRMCLVPSRILGIDRGTLGVGSVADIIVVDPRQAWGVHTETIVSKSKNSPFLGKIMQGVVTHTLCAGILVYKRGSPT